MKKSTLHSLLLISILLSFCTQSSSKKTPQSVAHKSQPAAQAAKTIIIQPLGPPAAAKTAEIVYRQIRGILPSVRLAPVKALPAFAFYRARQRYRADSLIGWMAKMAGPNETWLGIMVSDISTTAHGEPDYGIMGLGFSPGKACIASSYRLKDKTHFWKVAIHELGHTTGLPHCPVKTCFMRDAEKKNPTAEEKEFCADCKKKLTGLGWTL